jgi:uroporphyrinogen-III synthase
VALTAAAAANRGSVLPVKAVLTRARPAIAAYAATLAPLGLAAVALPVTRTAPPAPEEEERLARAIARLPDYDAIVVASAHAAHALLEAVRDPARLGGADAPAVWAVGRATASALAERGVIARTPAEAHARGLVAAMLAAGRPRRVLAPRAAGGRDEGLDALVAAGVAVDAIEAYRTVRADADDPALAAGLAALASAELALVAMFAPSQVEALDTLWRTRGGVAALPCPLVAIGSTTAAAIGAVGGRAAGIAGEPTPDGLAAAARAALGGRR